jgi:hypothetical protein
MVSIVVFNDWRAKCIPILRWRTPRMPLPALDIFKKDQNGNPVWIEAVGDLEAARHRLSQLTSALPGEYFAFDQRTHKIVEFFAGMSSETQL